MHEINDDYFFLHDYFLHDHCFFCRFVLQRNRYIRSVALVEVKSVLLPPRRLEASGVEFLRLVDKQ